MVTEIKYLNNEGTGRSNHDTYTVFADGNIISELHRYYDFGPSWDNIITYNPVDAMYLEDFILFGPREKTIIRFDPYKTIIKVRRTEWRKYVV